MKTTTLAVLGIAVLGLVLIVSMRGGSGSPKALSEKTNREVALTCTTDMATEFHIHPIVEVVINGESEKIPTNLGIRQNCMNSIHTHSSDGVVHVESPEKRDFTLGDFFAVWQEPFTKDEVLDYKTDGTHRVRVTVNGTEVETFEETVLKDEERITIYYESI